MADRDGIADLITNIQADVKTIIRDEIELAKAELLPQVKNAGIGAGMFGAAGYVAITASILLFFCLAFLVSFAVQAWFGVSMLLALFWGFLVMVILLLVVAGILVLVGKGKFAFHGPTMAIDSVEKSVAAIRGAATTTVEQVNATPLLPPRTPELESADR